MRTASQGQELPPIPYTQPLVPFLPKPDVRVLPPETGWSLWDAAVRELDTKQGRGA